MNHGSNTGPGQTRNPTPSEIRQAPIGQTARNPPAAEIGQTRHPPPSEIGQGATVHTTPMTTPPDGASAVYDIVDMDEGPSRGQTIRAPAPLPVTVARNRPGTQQNITYMYPESACPANTVEKISEHFLSCETSKRNFSILLIIIIILSILVSVLLPLTIFFGTWRDDSGHSESETGDNLLQIDGWTDWNSCST